MHVVYLDFGKKKYIAFAKSNALPIVMHEWLFFM